MNASQVMRNSAFNSFEPIRRRFHIPLMGVVWRSVKYDIALIKAVTPKHDI